MVFSKGEMRGRCDARKDRPLKEVRVAMCERESVSVSVRRGGEVASPAHEEENANGVTRVFCPSCGEEICGIKYNSVIYWKRPSGCEHVDVVRVGYDRDVRDVIRELEEAGGEILETARDGGYEVVIAHFDDDAETDGNNSVLDEIREREAEIRELCDYIKEHLNCPDCTTDDLINVAERIVTKLHVIRQLEEKL